MKTTGVDNSFTPEHSRFERFMRSEEKKVLQSMNNDAFAGIPIIRRGLGLCDGYHHNVTTYYGRVRSTFGDSIPEIRHGGNILDWGCSQGFTTFELAGIYKGRQVIGIELLEYMRSFMDYFADRVEEDPGYLRKVTMPSLRGRIKFERKPVFPSMFVIGDGYNAPFKNGSFDAVYCMNNLYYTLSLMNPSMAKKRVGQVCRLVANGGLLLVSGNNEGGEGHITFFILRKEKGKMRFELVSSAGTASEKLRQEVLAESIEAQKG